MDQNIKLSKNIKKDCVEDNHNYYVTKGELLVYNKRKKYTVEKIIKVQEAIGDTNDYKNIKIN